MPRLRQQIVYEQLASCEDLKQLFEILIVQMDIQLNDEHLDLLVQLKAEAIKIINLIEAGSIKQFPQSEGLLI